MERDIFLILVGAGIALVSSVVTSLVSEIIKYFVDRRRRIEERRIALVKSVIALDRKRLMFGAMSADDRSKLLRDIFDTLDKRPALKMSEEELVRFEEYVAFWGDEKMLQILGNAVRKQEEKQESD